MTRRGGQRGRGAGVRWWAVLLLAGLALLAACGTATQPRARATTTAGAHHSGTPAATVTPAPTTGPTATPVQIGDLGAFRQRFYTAFTSGKWANVQPLLSPEFSFQEFGSGSRLLMPYAQQNLQGDYGQGVPWSQGSDYELSIHSCYAGPTPLSQVMAFDGNDGHYLMFGLSLYQGYWVASWGYDDPQGGGDPCITGD